MINRPLTALGLILFCVANYLFAGLAARSVYGFPADTNPIILVEVTSDLVPVVGMLCALLILPILPATAAGRYWWRLHRNSALLTGVFFAITTLISILVTAWQGIRFVGLLRPELLLGLLYDLFMVVSLANFVLLLMARRLIAVGAMLAYIAIVVVLGQFFGLVQFIGFGTTPDQVITSFSSWPLGSASAWAWRAYWLAILAAFGFIVACLRSAAEKGARFVFVGSAIISLTFALIFGTATNSYTQQQEDRLSVPSDYLPGAYNSISHRPTARRFSIAIDMKVAGGPIEVSGKIDLTNETAAPIDHILLEKSSLLEIAHLASSLANANWHSLNHRLIGLHLAESLVPGETIRINFSGKILDPGIGFPARARIMTPEGVFLTSALVMPLPRTTACALPVGTLDKICGPGENYLLGDPASGEVSVTVPQGWTVAGAVGPDAGPRSRILVDEGQWSNFVVVAAPFRRSTVAAQRGCPTLDIYLSRRTRLDAVSLANSFCDEWRHLVTDFGDEDLERFWLGEVPDHIALGQSLRDGILLSDRLLIEEGAGNAVLRHVLAHEIAHLFWGYRIAPGKAPGMLFALEAIPQYLAFTNVPDDEGLTAKADRLANVRIKQGGSPVEEKRLWRSSNLADAYLSQPRALLLVDARSDGKLRNALADSYRELATRSAVSVTPDEIVSAIRKHLSQEALRTFDLELGFESSKTETEASEGMSAGYLSPDDKSEAEKVRVQ